MLRPEQLFNMAFVSKEYSTVKEIANSIDLPLGKTYEKISKLRVKAIVEFGQEESSLRHLPLR